ncbi:Alpha/Beta hydrolase protein [Gongronella butleri]|nr:Alpha/Beta hydrolase protein [Gongronella butleri]
MSRRHRAACFILALSLLYAFIYREPPKIPQWTQYTARHSSPAPSTMCNHVHHAGYIDFPDTNDHYFFLYYPSNQSTRTILWLNGGPGCSSLQGAWAGIGPCTVTTDGLVANAHTWLKDANLLFLDQPIGVGYSHGATRINRSVQGAQHVYAFLQAFFDAFPEFLGNHLIIAGESYAGKYLPALSDDIMAQNALIRQGRAKGTVLPLQGIILGNAWVDPMRQLASFHTFGCLHRPPYLPLFDAETCGRLASRSRWCQSLMKRCYDHPGALWACIPAGVYCLATQMLAIDALGVNPMDIRVPCADDTFCNAFERDLAAFADRADVRSQLRVDSNVPPFVNCRSSVETRFMLAMDQVLDASPSIQNALNQGVRVLLLTGDMDWLCNWVGVDAWAQALTWQGHAGFAQASEQPIALSEDSETFLRGKIKAFGGLTTLKVHDAGHMAAWDQPALVQKFISQWLSRPADGNLDLPLRQNMVS